MATGCVLHVKPSEGRPRVRVGDAEVTSCLEEALSRFGKLTRRLVPSLMAVCAATAVVGTEASVSAESVNVRYAWKSQKTLVGYGWEFLGATTDDVHRNRAKFAATGLDGVILPIDGKKASGKILHGRYLMSGYRYREDDFKGVVPKLREITACAGLSESMALTMLIPDRRIAWDDDAAWSTVSNNMAIVARLARAGGLKGLTIDHEDYNKALQFWRHTDDPADVVSLARLRGRQVFGGMFAEFPDAKILGFWLFSDSYRLWQSFLDGLLDVAPSTARLVDGNENYGYEADALKDDFRRDVWYVARRLKGIVAPENRAKYDACISVSFGQYMDMYTNERKGTYYFGPLDGSRVARLEDNLANAMRYSDDLVWIYGERGTWIDWDRKDNPKLAYPTWECQLPGVTRALRIAAGDGAAIDADIAAGALTNLIANADCDPVPGQDVPFYGWTRLGEPAPKGIFDYEPEDGFPARGCLKLMGDGCFCLGAGNLKPGETVYLRVWTKGGGHVGYDWQSGTKRHWYADRNILFPTGRAVGEWKEVFARLRVPEGMDKLNFALYGGTASATSPVLFDNVGLFVKVRK